MPLRRIRSVRAFVGLAGVLVLLAPVAVMVPDLAAAQSLDDLEEAEERAARIDAEIDAATERYEATWAQLEQLQVEVDELRAHAADLEREAAAIEERLGERARTVYKYGSTATMQTLLNSSSAQDAVERAGLLSALYMRDGAELEDAVAARVAMNQTRERVRQRELELLETIERLEQEGEALEALFESAETQVATLEAVVSRPKWIDRGAQQGEYACIFAPRSTHFRDTWGAPRSGGRRHKGTDVFAAYGAPVFAFTSGVIQRHSNSGLGGIGLYLRGDDGNVYYYAHLDSIDPSATVGTRVEPGEQVARNGSTGNASASAPHVHFQLHPGGGSAVNPYQWLAAACF